MKRVPPGVRMKEEVEALLRGAGQGEVAATVPMEGTREGPRRIVVGRTDRIPLKCPLGVLAVVMLLSRSAAAQTGGYGYAFGGPAGVHCCGSTEGMLHVGGGGEVVVGETLGLGAELGYFTPWRSLGDGIGLFSLNGSVHFGSADRAVRPFATGGYTLIFREEHASLWNVGGGVNWWAKRRVGLRAEFRDHIYSPSKVHHYFSAQIGVVFR